jgi:hypothetical protein
MVAGTMILYACATPQSSSQDAALKPAQSKGHIYVTSGDLNSDCYEDLGEIAVNETFAQSVVESPDSQAQQLRQLAEQKYPGKADAVINVREQQNDAGTAVKITGEAVHLQNGETVGCAMRAMPGVLDAASATAAGGIVGTVIGGLSQQGGSVQGAEAGGAMGASVGAGVEMVKRRQQQQAQEAFIGDRLKLQNQEITQLYQQLTKLIGQQCDTEELSEQECEQRIAAVERQVEQPSHTAQGSAQKQPAASGDSPGSGTANFQIRNRIQEQQEIIDQLRERIAEVKHNADNQ